ncbi:NUDIX domain-containing protein [Virgibacillus sp. C22-A2]|uniref:NUDIX domain-containing protein n=1 Tax=Virgibacillus tibetensis TaxID=3042313 RepID=A0ABU6KKW4_9BACI|nr:NUDIX domain-containing protein [Virgibacillus sp. C22-A2]
MELWDLYDIDRNKLGLTHLRGIPLPKGRYHLVVHVWIQNDKGQLILSKRHPDKHFGNLWECTGGSVLQGENSLEGALREVEEELGIKLSPDSGKLLHSEVKETHHLDYWFFISNVDIKDLELQADEVIDAKWVDQETNENMIRCHETTPALKHFYDLISKYR